MHTKCLEHYLAHTKDSINGSSVNKYSSAFLFLACERHRAIKMRKKWPLPLRILQQRYKAQEACGFSQQKRKQVGGGCVGRCGEILEPSSTWWQGPPCYDFCLCEQIHFRLLFFFFTKLQLHRPHLLTQQFNAYLVNALCEQDISVSKTL